MDNFGQSIITRQKIFLFFLLFVATRLSEIEVILDSIRTTEVCVHINYDETSQLFTDEIMHALTRMLLSHSLDSPLFNYQIH